MRRTDRDLRDYPQTLESVLILPSYFFLSSRLLAWGVYPIDDGTRFAQCHFKDLKCRNEGILMNDHGGTMWLVLFMLIAVTSLCLLALR